LVKLKDFKYLPLNDYFTATYLKNRMRYLRLGTIAFVLLLPGCSENNKAKMSSSKADTIKTAVHDKVTGSKKDKEEIQGLIRYMLSWGESKDVIQLVPVLTDRKDSMCTGFDLNALNANLKKLKATNFFSTEFIENYNNIILTLDKKMKNKEFSEWPTGELPPFNFANDVDLWCDCQDVPYDTPDAYSLVDVHVVSLNNNEGELYWKWGKLGNSVSQDWKDFSYKFKVKKENGKWKVSYLEGFDFAESIKI
jgi:hypothetical protein